MNRKTYSRSKFRARDALPIWSPSQTHTTNAIARLLFEKLSITDLPSYWTRLQAPIVICIVLGASMGAYRSGFEGLIWFGLAGFVTPAALIVLGAVLSYVAVYLAAFFAAWMVLFHGVLWLLGQ